MLVRLLLVMLMVLCCGLGMYAVAWYISQRLLNSSFAGWPSSIHILGVTEDTVTIERTSASGKPGVYGIDWPEGYALLGEIVEASATSVTRRLLEATQPPPTGLHVNWNIYVYRGTPQSALGLPFSEVAVEGQLGPMPAWFLTGERRTWVILVHGIRGSREEGLRVLKLLTGLELPVLDISYRNDPEAPRSSDGLYHLGDTEWQDLEAAVRYALEHGAEDVVLYGWSMGGNLVQTFLRRSHEAGHVRAIVLDAPTLDYRALTRKQARLRLFAIIMEHVITLRTGLSVDALDHVKQARSITKPTLLFHGVQDELNPVASSDAFAQARPDLVTYHRVNDADHTGSWNADSQAYEAALKSFLERTLGLASEGVRAM